MDSGEHIPQDINMSLFLPGSPIGATIGYLLMQHKSELGSKYVSGIAIMRNDRPKDGPEAPDLVFYIRDGPPEKFIPDALEQDPQGQAQPAAIPAAPVLRNIAIRGLSDHSVEEHVLGPNNILRVHTIMAY